MKNPLDFTLRQIELGFTLEENEAIRCQAIEHINNLIVMIAELQLRSRAYVVKKDVDKVMHREVVQKRPESLDASELDTCILVSE